MKRLFSIVIFLFVTSTFLFSQEDSEDFYTPADPDTDTQTEYFYETNGKGDKFIKINLGALFPLNFENQLSTGGLASIGYFQFLNKWLAVGGEFSATYNISIGEKTLLTLPFTLGVMMQPSINKFEFPMYAEIGMTYANWQNSEIFPALVTKLSAGAFYRINDSCSFGVSTDFFWMPQWFKDSSLNFNGLFETATIGLRYHF